MTDPVSRTEGDAMSDEGKKAGCACGHSWTQHWGIGCHGVVIDPNKTYDNVTQCTCVALPSVAPSQQQAEHSRQETRPAKCACLANAHSPDCALAGTRPAPEAPHVHDPNNPFCAASPELAGKRKFDLTCVHGAPSPEECGTCQDDKAGAEVGDAPVAQPAAMKLIVLHEDGRQNHIELCSPCTIHEGAELDRISSASGGDYYFTKDGYYDGSGTGASCMLPEPEKAP